jgi:hypothetical protein
MTTTPAVVPVSASSMPTSPRGKPFWATSVTPSVSMAPEPRPRRLFVRPAPRQPATRIPRAPVCQREPLRPSPSVSLLLSRSPCLHSCSDYDPYGHLHLSSYEQCIHIIALHGSHPRLLFISPPTDSFDSFDSFCCTIHDHSRTCSVCCVYSANPICDLVRIPLHLFQIAILYQSRHDYTLHFYHNHCTCSCLLTLSS